MGLRRRRVHQLEALTARRSTTCAAAWPRSNRPLFHSPLARRAGLSLTASSSEANEPPRVPPGLLPAVGRLLLGIAGAYLFRAITEAHILPELAGTALGIIYAAAWLVSSIGTRADRRLAAAFEGITASCILAPLLWEATCDSTRFRRPQVPWPCRCS